MSSQYVTINTVAMVMKAMIEALKDKTGINSFEFDPQMGYETTINQVRNFSSQNSGKKKTFPILSYNRSVLRQHEGLGMRNARAITGVFDPQMPSGDVQQFRAAQCDFDFRFQLIAQEMSDVENFEIMYASREGITNITTLWVDLGSYGKFQYDVTWTQPLDDVIINLDGSFYKTVLGSARITGWFVTLGGTDKLILDIYKDTYTQSGKVLVSQDHIH